MGYVSKDVLIKTQHLTIGMAMVKQVLRTLGEGCMNGNYIVTAFPWWT